MMAGRMHQTQRSLGLPLRPHVLAAHAGGAGRACKSACGYVAYRAQSMWKSIVFMCPPTGYIANSATTTLVLHGLRGRVRDRAMGATGRRGAAGTQQRGRNPHGSIIAPVCYGYDVMFALSLWPVPNIWGCNPHAAAQCVPRGCRAAALGMRCNPHPAAQCVYALHVIRFGLIVATRTQQRNAYMPVG